MGGADKPTSTTKKRPITYWLGGCGIGLGILLAASAWYIYWVNQAFGQHMRYVTQIISPDGRSVATLAYSEGFFDDGFFFVCLQPAAGWHPLQPDDPIPHDEVAEVDEMGLQSIAWDGAHKLLVKYDKVWRDVQIVYRGS